ADLVVLNKTDLHPEPEAVADWLRERCQAPVIAARDAAVPLDVLLAPAVATLHHEVDTAPADLTFRRGAIELAEPIDREALLQMLAGLAPSVVRAKGFAWVADEPERAVLVQRVGRRTTLTPWRPWDQMDRPPATHIVTIELKPKT
ncbi:MAG: GTP-binding protein, partial [Acidimicrobiales bacterium]|nr:GTP-binding protein [Acidimicrobiales bacterium]